MFSLINKLEYEGQLHVLHWVKNKNDKIITTNGKKLIENCLDFFILNFKKEVCIH